ncbi:hypothetical protein CDIK_0633 [Cucumispora dikerogammari]|nr:hypothetical protein CDIK_0633 [Cucumispora dikerogammari]
MFKFKYLTQQKLISIWSLANKLTIILHTIYFLTRIVQLPFLKDIPSTLNILPLIIAYSCICFHRLNSGQSIRNDINLYTLIYFLSLPPMFCLLPFTLNTFITLAKNELSKLHSKKIVISDLEFGKYQANFHFFLLENKVILYKLVIHLEIISFCLTVILLFTGRATVFNLMCLFTLLKFEFEKDKVFRKVCLCYFEGVDYLLKKESPLKEIYLKMRNVVMELFEGYSEEEDSVGEKEEGKNQSGIKTEGEATKLKKD